MVGRGRVIMGWIRTSVPLAPGVRYVSHRSTEGMGRAILSLLLFCLVVGLAVNFVKLLVFWWFITLPLLVIGGYVLWARWYLRD